jgi:hypothetical protein
MEKDQFESLIQEIRYLRDAVVSMTWVNAALLVQFREANPQVNATPFDLAAGEAWNLMQRVVALSKQKP